jgi:hypothetical protein
MMSTVYIHIHTKEEGYMAPHINKEHFSTVNAMTIEMHTVGKDD